MHTLLFFSGSSRKGSVNTRLAQAAAEVAKAAFGADTQITVIDLADFDAPTFDGSEVSPDQLPENARRLRKLIIASDGIFMGSDEYTGTYSTLFRNLIGWLTHQSQEHDNIFEGKPIALCGASSRGVGGLRGHPALQQLLSVIGAHVISQQITLGTSASAFDENTQLLPRVEKQLREGALSQLVNAITARTEAVAPIAKAHSTT